MGNNEEERVPKEGVEEPCENPLWESRFRIKVCPKYKFPKLQEYVTRGENDDQFFSKIFHEFMIHQ